MSLGAQTPQSSGHWRYRVLDEILRSRTHCILRARDTDLNREVLVAFCGGGSAAARSAFEREGRIVASITTQFVVDVYDGGRHDGRPYIVFERLTRSLTDAFAAGGPTHEGVVQWGRELLEAVSSLRVAGVEFGMLRPELVGITESGHVRVSPWPLRSEKTDWWTPTTSNASDLEQVAALLRPGAVDLSRLAALQEVSAGADQNLSTTLLSASGAHTESVPEATMETSEPTAPVLMGPWMPNRRPTRWNNGRRSPHRAWYGVAAAAAIVVFAAIAMAGSLVGQTPAKGTPTTHQGARGTHHSTLVAPRAGPAHSDSSLQEPVLNVTTAQPDTTQATIPATTTPPPSVVTPDSSAAATSAAGDPTTTSTTTPPATTTTTQSPSATTTTTSPPVSDPGSVSTGADATGPPAPG